MTRDLAKTVPSAVLTAVSYVLKESERCAAEARLAHPKLYADLLDQSREFRRQDDGMVGKMAEAIFDWAMGLPRQLLPPLLGMRLKSRGVWPCLTIFDQTIDLSGDAPANKLHTVLELCLIPQECWLFRRHAWLNGYLMQGGAQLNTVTAIELGLHPQELRALHDHIAEGKVWTQVETGLHKLLSDFKDR
jgi:hypothetical protein